MVASLNTSRPLKGQTPVYGDRLVSVTSTTSVTLDDTYDGKDILIDNASGVTIILPAANGTGWKARFRVKTTITSNTGVIKVANTTDVMNGNVIQCADGGSSVVGWEAAATDDTITMDGSTRGGIIGDYIEIMDVASGIFHVYGVISGTGTEATPFSATV